MSSISGASAGNGLYQFLQNVSANSQSQATSATSSTTSSSASDSSTPVQGGHHHRHRAGGAQNSQLFQQLQQAVTSALQSTQEDGTDPNTAIKDAITQVFRNNNSGLQTAGTATSSTTSSEAAANTPASVKSGISSTTSGTAANGSSSLQAFFQSLQSFGVDPQQFHQDFLAAAQGAQNGTLNPSTAFQSFPPGSLVDAIG